MAAVGIRDKSMEGRTMKNRKKLVPVAAAFVMFAFLAATSFFIILSVRLTLSPREILRNIEYVPDTNVVAEVVDGPGSGRSPYGLLL